MYTKWVNKQAQDHLFDIIYYTLGRNQLHIFVVAPHFPALSTADPNLFVDKVRGGRYSSCLWKPLLSYTPPPPEKSTNGTYHIFLGGILKNRKGYFISTRISILSISLLHLLLLLTPTHAYAYIYAHLHFLPSFCSSLFCLSLCLYSHDITVV